MRKVESLIPLGVYYRPAESQPRVGYRRSIRDYKIVSRAEVAGGGRGLKGSELASGSARTCRRGEAPYVRLLSTAARTLSVTCNRSRLGSNVSAPLGRQPARPPLVSTNPAGIYCCSRTARMTLKLSTLPMLLPFPRHCCALNNELSRSYRLVNGRKKNSIS